VTLALLLLFRLSFPHFSATSIATCIVCSVTALPNTLQAEIVCHVPANGHFHPSKVWKQPSKVPHFYCLACWCYNRSISLLCFQNCPPFLGWHKERCGGYDTPVAARSEVHTSYGLFGCMATRIGTPWSAATNLEDPSPCDFGHKHPSSGVNHEGSHAQISRMFSQMFSFCFG